MADCLYCKKKDFCKFRKLAEETELMGGGYLIVQCKLEEKEGNLG